MAVIDYSSLKQYVINRIARDDYGDEQAADDVAFAEAVINRKLRTGDSVSTDTITTEAEKKDYPLPSTFLSLSSIGYSDRGKLRQLSPQEIADRVSSLSHRPDAFSISGRKITFYPTPDTEYTINYAYLSKVPALSVSNTTNWMVTDYPDVYSDAVMYHALKRFRDPLAVDFKALMDAGIEEINTSYRSDVLASPIDMVHNVSDKV